MRAKLINNIKQVEQFILDAGVKCTSEIVEGEKKRTLGDFVFDLLGDFDLGGILFYLLY